MQHYDQVLLLVCRTTVSIQIKFLKFMKGNPRFKSSMNGNWVIILVDYRLYFVSLDNARLNKINLLRIP